MGSIGGRNWEESSAGALERTLLTFDCGGSVDFAARSSEDVRDFFFVTGVTEEPSVLGAAGSDEAWAVSAGRERLGLFATVLLLV
jgi:hypothetical protein